MKKIEITKKQARRFILTHQNLLPPRTISGKQEILNFFQRIGCIQYDPLNIVGNNPELVLQSRIKGFKPGILEEMLYTDRTLVDDWDKMMAIYPVTDRPHFRYRQLEAAKRDRRRNADYTLAVIPEILQEIKERGPLSSIDFDHDRKVAWSWGPTRLAKVALDDMYYQGELVIHHKLNTRKFYDLASRHIPAEILKAPDPHETHEDYQDWHVHRRLRGLGLAWSRSGIWVWIHRTRTKERVAILERLVNRGEIAEVKIEEIRYPFFVSSMDLSTLEETGKMNEISHQAAIIAPLDNLMWDRELIKILFGFNYRWEVYKPVKEREYGYYVLPVICGDRFIARFEPGRDKNNGALVIKNWWWEKDVELTQDIKNALKDCFNDFLDYLGTTRLKINKKLVDREDLNCLL
ncbi:MAG: YcaQ family DNA glycosylase [Dehalococcoidales bacterium]|nr:MAG: YcaQ family DNA glycosylase [Dehalococcoidales bacterium]